MDCFFLISFGVGQTTNSGTKEPHQFSEKKCWINHLDIDKITGEARPSLDKKMVDIRDANSGNGLSIKN